MTIEPKVISTNIKNLPLFLESTPLNYFTEIGWSQSYPWVEVKRTAKSVTLMKVDVKGDPEWQAKKQFIPGGFCGHTPNQSEQTWLFDKFNKNKTTRIFMTKRGTWKRKGVKFVEGSAREFYDYNF